MRSLALKLGLDKEINASIPLLKRRRGYAESDHILAMVFNPLHGGQTLDDVRCMRRDPALLKVLDAESLSDPTTLGDFCRRFNQQDCEAFQDGINRVRLNVWSMQPESFFE